MSRDDIYFIPETSGLSEIKKLLLVGGLVGVSVGLFGLASSQFTPFVKMIGGGQFLFLLYALGTACASGGAVVFYSIKKMPRFLVQATWIVLIGALYSALFSFIDWSIF